MDIYQILEKGGLMVWPILLCSVVGATIFVERLLLYRRVSGQFGDNSDLFALVSNRKFDKAIQILEHRLSNDAVDSLIMLETLKVDKPDRETLEMVLMHGVEKTVKRLARTLSTLGVLASVSPLLGLLGTVIGMIKAFMVVESMGGSVNATVLAGGIWEAMLTTAVGLLAAIPLLFFHNHLENRLSGIQGKLEDVSIAFLKAWANGHNSG